MSDAQQIDRLLVDRIRDGDSRAWSQLIAKYEGRLLAFSETRLRSRATSEDIVQETFVGFLTSLPNYDCRRPLESYLFSICAHKLTDHLRREGRRPTLPLSSSGGDHDEPMQIAGLERGPSTIVRSAERRGFEDDSLAAAIGDLIDRWRQKGDWTKLKCLEMLFVRGRSNKAVANRLGLSEQQVANYKSDFLMQLKKMIRKQGLPVEVFQNSNRIATTMTEPHDYSDSELEAYLEEALPTDEAAKIEEALRGDPDLVNRLSSVNHRRDSGLHTLGEIWRRHRLSCPPRQQLGSYLLDVLDQETANYIYFHVTEIGCRYCEANLEDLKKRQDEENATTETRRRKYFESSAGLLR